MSGTSYDTSALEKIFGLTRVPKFTGVGRVYAKLAK
jgi:hypothetical protein